MLWALTKPEVNFLILITTGVGLYLGCGNEARACLSYRCSTLCLEHY
jgi:hypothetical protein